MPVSNRVEKVNSLLQQQIGKIICNDFDFGPENLITVTRVDTSANLIETKVFVSVFPEDKSDAVVSKLQRGAWSVQKKIDRLLNMRPIPKIIFKKDTNPSQAGRVQELLAELKFKEK